MDHERRVRDRLRPRDEEVQPAGCAVRSSRPPTPGRASGCCWRLHAHWARLSKVRHVLASTGCLRQLATVHVLVTGAGGFVGQRLVPRLETEGCRVSAYDVDLDIMDEPKLRATFARLRPDAIIHLAAMASVAASHESSLATFRVNFIGTKNVLAAAEEVVPRARVVFVGSGEVYGATDHDAAPFDESSPLAPRSPYAHTKASADLLCGEYAARGLDIVRARPFNHTGPGQSERFVAPSFAQQVAEISRGRREPRIRVGSLDAVRDFLDVEDVISAYIRLLDPTLPGGIYNVASGVGRSIGTVLHTLIRKAEIAPEIVIDPARVRPSDRIVGCADHLRAQSGWAPKVAFDDTLARLLSWWLNRIGS